MTLTLFVMTLHSNSDLLKSVGMLLTEKELPKVTTPTGTNPPVSPETPIRALITSWGVIRSPVIKSQGTINL